MKKVVIFVLAVIVVVSLGFLIMKLKGGVVLSSEETVQDLSETDFSQLDDTVSGL